MSPVDSRSESASITRGAKLMKAAPRSGSTDITREILRRRSPRRSSSPTPTPRACSSCGSTHTVPGAGTSRVGSSAPPAARCTRRVPRKGYSGDTAFTAASEVPSPSAASAMLGKLTVRASIRPSLRARSATSGPMGWSADSTTSAPSNWVASRSRPRRMRSTKKPTLVTAATATTSAAQSRRSSPARQSRRLMRKACANVWARFMSGAPGLPAWRVARRERFRARHDHRPGS